MRKVHGSTVHERHSSDIPLERSLYPIPDNDRLWQRALPTCSVLPVRLMQAGVPEGLNNVPPLRLCLLLLSGVGKLALKGEYLEPD